jgi:protein-S-isoprenylcysteine O-methyltransferase Ste14
MQTKDLLSFILAFAAWSVLHSLTASLGFKTLVRRRIGQRAYDGLYRLLYNLTSFLTFLPVLYLGAVILPRGVVWRIPVPVNLLFFFLQAVGILGLLLSLLQTDLLRFAGLGQAVRYLQGASDLDPPARLVTSGTYALVRHPLYAFSLLFLWFTPLMTWSMLIFNVGATLYFWIGSIYEERRLLAAFGDAYRAYKKEVPRLLPIRLRS